MKVKLKTIPLAKAIAIFMFTASCEGLLDPGKTASSLHITLDSLHVSKHLFVCQEGHPSYDKVAKECKVRMSLCPVDASLSLDLSKQHIQCNKLTRRKGDRSSILLNAKPGQMLTFSTSEEEKTTRDFRLNLGLVLTNYLNWHLLWLNVLFESASNSSISNQAIGEIAILLTKTSGKLEDKLVLGHDLYVAEHLLGMTKDENEHAGFRLAKVSMHIETTCAEGFFPAGKCTVFTGCKESECVRCHPTTGAFLCGEEDCFLNNSLTLPKECGEQVQAGDTTSDGRWGNWTKWGECPLPCGWSLRSRRRDCINPSPSGSGKACNGSSLQLELCRNTICPLPPFPAYPKPKQHQQHLPNHVRNEHHKKNRNSFLMNRTPLRKHSYPGAMSSLGLDLRQPQALPKMGYRELSHASPRFGNNFPFPATLRKQGNNPLYGDDKEKQGFPFRAFDPNSNFMALEKEAFAQLEKVGHRVFGEEVRHKHEHMQKWMRTQSDFDYDRRELHKKLRQLQHEHFWTRAALGLSALSLLLTLIWIIAGSCCSNKKRDARPFSTPSCQLHLGMMNKFRDIGCQHKHQKLLNDDEELWNPQLDIKMKA